MKDRDRVKEIQKDTEQMMRELKAKEDTINMHINRIDQQMIEQQELIKKFERYQSKAETEGDASRFALQKKQAEDEKQSLLSKRSEYEQTLRPFQNSYQTLENGYEQTAAYLTALQTEAATKQKEAEMITQLNQYEEKVRRELAEAEAILELKKDSF